MSSVKSASSLGEPNGREGSEGAILKSGYIRKLKTGRKKFFIIRGDSTDSSVSTARIEYYDNEKKWRSNQPPKRSILIKTCFNINRRTDTQNTRHSKKLKYVIALYTKDDCFCLDFDTEEEMADWLKTLLSLQQGEDIVDGESPKPTFEHVWPVDVAKRGLGSIRNILGPHLLCLTDRTLSLVNKQSENNETYEFSLTNIRRCGDMESFFYMEVGRSSCTGAGDLWMLTEDVNIARNMHAAILHAMSNNSNNKEELAPRPRNRSSSANDASKPISMLQRRQTHAGQKPGSFFTAEDGVLTQVTGGMASSAAAAYCDTLASSAAGPVHIQSTQVTSVGSLPGSNVHTYQHYHQRIAPAAHPPLSVRPSQRRHSVSGTTNSGRDRCDSMPSRARTTSEGHHGQPTPHTVRNVHLVPGHNRPHSMYTRGISYSPPIGSSPVSPNSAACSTDSAGSSLSVDDEHNWMETESNIFGMGRYGHSLTPDEPIIFEENIIEGDENSSCTTEEKLNNYMPMNSASLSLPIKNQKPSIPIKFSPNLSSGGFKSGSPSGYMEMYSPCGSSPLDTVGAFIGMSPGPGASVDMMTRYGRSASSASHSRASSLAEDGYVPMAPGQVDDGYVDMDPTPNDHFGTGDMSPGNSSCSIASGTPSTDLRFSEYPLEKVSSYFTPSEEDESACTERPARAYSVGSRPCSTPKARREPTLPTAESARVRAFSVGSRVAKAAFLARHAVASATPPAGNKSSSAPLLSHSWSGSPTLKPPLYVSGEPMDDLMEMDFSKNSQKSLKNRTNLRNSSRIDALPPTHATPHEKLHVPLNNLSLSPNNLSSSPNASQDTSGYLDMTPSKFGLHETSGYLGTTPSKLGLNSLSSPTPIPVVPKNSGPYVEMKPGFGGDLSRCHSASPPQMNHLIRNVVLSGSPKSSFMMAAGSPPTRLLAMSRKSSVLGNAPYVDSLGQVSSEPRIGSPSSIFAPQRNNEAYMDMRGPQPQHFPSTSGPTHIPSRTNADIFPMTRKPTSPIQEEYMDMSMKQVKQESNLANRSAPVNTPQPRLADSTSAYVDMSSGPSNRGLVPSGSGQTDDYMNMNMSSEGRRRKDRKGSRKDKQRFSSQPIAIQSGQSSSTESNSKPGSSASTSPVFSLANMMTTRKTSSETPPKIPGFLSLGSGNLSPGSSPFSSLRRSRNRKATRRGSSEVNLATPTGSTTGIFPFSLNSPGSPMKPLPGGKSDSFDYNRKCPVDASSGTVCISYPYPDGSSGSNPVTPDSSSSSEQPTPVNVESLATDLAKSEVVSDYVNYNPARTTPQETASKPDEFGDYAIMRPVRTTRRISTPLFSAVKNFDKSPQKKFSLSSTSSPTTLVSTKIVNAPVVLKTTPLKQATILPSASFRPISVNPTTVTTSAADGSSSPKLKSSFASTKSTTLFNRQLSSTSASSTESGKSQDISVKDTSASVLVKGAGSVCRQLSNSSVKSLSAASESARDDGTYENLSTCSSGGVSPVPSSRPESVTCDREIHYASLDLPNEGDDASSKSPRNFKAQSSLTESTPSPNPGQEASFTYAEIDFAKSESLKNCSSTSNVNRKVCHGAANIS